MRSRIIRQAAGLLAALWLAAGLPGAARAEEDLSVKVWKKPDQHNPVMVQQFGADPWAMVYGGRVYLYMTGDEPVMLADGSVRTNDYGNIRSLRILSSADLVNWTDHGDVKAAGPEGAARWANNSWAPCAAWKTIDGQDRFFLYFANSGGGIGVLTSDSPTGPFTDPLGRPLVSRSTPTCAAVTWLFDPAVLVDDDGAAYLYFGGGIPGGKAAAPGTARVVRLAPDMISLDGVPEVIDAPWLFEDSGINKFGDTYVYSYCSNFQVPPQGSEQGFFSGEIVCLTSDSPMGPFVWGRRVLKNPGAYFGVGGNNHHCMFSFGGQWYITYHAATLDRDRKWNAGYRSTFVDVLRLGDDGLPALSTGTMKGVAQLAPVDPYTAHPAVMLATLAGVEVVQAEDAASGQRIVRAAQAQGWTAVCGVDFGEKGASAVRLTCRSGQETEIRVLTDDPDTDAIGAVSLTAGTEWRTVTAAFREPMTGVHDLFFQFGTAGAEMLEWTAVPAE